MLTIVSIGTLLLLLFLLVYMSLNRLLNALADKSMVRLRLRRRPSAWTRRLDRLLSRMPYIVRHVNELMDSANGPLSGSAFLWITACLSLFGAACGLLAIGTWKGTITLVIVLGGLPYLWLRMRVIRLQMRARLEFLPGVEVFYQAYVIHGEGSTKHVLRELLSERRLPEPLLIPFDRLMRDLLLHSDTEAALRLFAVRLGHKWARLFAELIRMELSEGIGIETPLKDLIDDMRRAQLADRQQRNKLLEIRVANFTPLLFLALFLLLNYRMNPDTFYRYYLLDKDGRDMLLDSALLIFASFCMGVYLSTKKM